jgi:HTH-type transcriptional regulator/antitoxin HigA
MTRLRLALASKTSASADDLFSKSEVAEAKRRALVDEYERLQLEIEAYDKLSSDERDTGEIDAEKLGLLPIVGRIARHLSQRQLAELLGTKEQQIQRYEQERYAGISLARFERILDTLGIEIEARFLSSRKERLPPLSQQTNDFNFQPELIREIRRRRWLDFDKKMPSQAAGLTINAYIKQGIELSSGKTLHRKKLRNNSQFDDLALISWQARVLNLAHVQRSRIRSTFNILEMDWLQQLVRQSAFADGPLRAAALLRSKGIVLVIERHLPHTYLDGAALMLADGTPVIALTLRHDRLTNFWFTLLHEVAHIFLHFNRGLSDGFLDNLDIASENQLEKEADSFAQDALIPARIWNSAPARFAKSIDLLKAFARLYRIHLSIVVGRVQHERDNHAVFSEWVGRGEVRRLFKSHTS